MLTEALIFARVPQKARNSCKVPDGNRKKRIGCYWLVSEEGELGSCPAVVTLVSAEPTQQMASD